MISLRTDLLLGALATVVAVAPITAQDPRPPIPLEVVLERPAEITPDLPDHAWIPDDPGALREVVKAGPDGTPLTVFRVEVRTRERTKLFDAPQLLAALAAGGAELEPDAELPEFEMLGPRVVRVVAGDAVWTWKVGEQAAQRRLLLMPSATESAIAPGDGAGAFVVDANVHVRTADGTTRQLTEDGRAQDIVYGGAAHRAEFGIHDGLWWDPSGRRLAFSREDMTPIAPFPYVDLRARPPHAEHGRYPMAGSTHSRVTIGVYDVAADELVYLESDPSADVYWTNVTFTPDGSEVWVALVDRSQSSMELVAFDAASGARGRTLLRESDPEWVEPEHGPIFLPDGSGFLWFSPRGGYRQLYRYTLDGEPKWMETPDRFDIRSFVGFSADLTQAYVTAGGHDPRQNHLFAVRLGPPTPPMMMAADARPKVVNLTAYGPGWHECEIAEDDSILDVWSSVHRAGMISAVLADSGNRYHLGHVADPREEYRVAGQQMFTVTAEDGTTLYGHVMFPPSSDPLVRHPVLLYVYGGPHVQLVQDRWQGGANLWLQFMASQGYVVVRLDGRGTPWRGIDFEQMVHGNLGEIEVVDQLHALEWVRQNVRQADMDRVGVHGWSYGGYMTLRLMLLAPDDFVCGVAGAPVTDWRGYETGYTERYMDTPEENADGYDASSVLPLVGNLKGRLLLVHGTDDKTVMWSHAMAFLDRAIDEGVLVDFMAYPMSQHGLRGDARKHFVRLMTRYFFDHLPPPPSSSARATAAHHHPIGAHTEADPGTLKR